MELKEFVSETLVQISDGIDDAQRRLRESGSEAKVNPYMTKDGTGKLVTGGKRKNVEIVDFDVAILVNEGTETNARVGLSVASLLNLGAGGRSEQSSGTESRIRFSIPASFTMYMPDTQNEEKT